MRVSGSRATRWKLSLRGVVGPARPSLSGAPSRTLAEVLAAAGPDPDRLTHGMHAYPARMHPDVARAALRAFAPGSRRVLDPFCGSGTVLVEALVAGHVAAGVDLSPLAVRLSRLKTARPDAVRRARFLDAADAVVRASLRRVRARAEARAPLAPSLARWFEGHVLRELAGLHAEIEAVADPWCREALRFVLSAILLKVSRRRSETAVRTFARTIRKGLPTELFHARAVEWAGRWERLVEAAPVEAPDPRVVEGDARRLGQALGPAAQFDLVLTSPPYGGTYDYVAHHELRHPWLGIDATALRRDEIGARRRLGGPRAAAQWDREMREVLVAIRSVLAPGALAVLLVGDACVGGARVDAAGQLVRLAPDAGLRVLGAARASRRELRRGVERAEHLVAFEAASPSNGGSKPRFGRERGPSR
ncbi:MAG: hypothetical protein NZ898_00365 [Myxococcota bacterium]|nr:hypothetical protein [Myxococcota bacterium]MDW8361996.1 hypothetical protein [Myxococcales bacterium]